MKKSELKTVIKECVKEVLFEEGVLSEIIAEVAFGITKAQNLISEQTIQDANSSHLQEQAALQEASRREAAEAQRKKLLETKRRMLDAIGNESMANVFEGTEPLSNADSGVGSPMSGISPGDSGVDISGLFGLAGDKWRALK